MRRDWLMALLAALALAFGSTAAAASEAENENGEADADATEEQAVDRSGHVRIVGSRITRDLDEYNYERIVTTSSPVRVYTREELERSGHRNIGEALRSIDSRVH